MRTGCSSNHHGGVWSWSPLISPLGVGLDLIPLHFPLGCGPGSDPPQFLPWLWAWIWSPSISPLAVGLELIPLNFPLGCGPGSDPPQFPPWLWTWTWSPSIFPLGVGLEGGLPLVGGSPWQGVSLAGGGSPWWGVTLAGGCIPACTEADPPVNRMTDDCENITLPQTSFAGGKNIYPLNNWEVNLPQLWNGKNGCTYSLSDQFILVQLVLIHTLQW